MHFIIVLLNLAKKKNASVADYGLIKISPSNHFIVTIKCLLFKLLVPYKRIFLKKRDRALKDLYSNVPFDFG